MPEEGTSFAEIAEPTTPDATATPEVEAEATQVPTEGDSKPEPETLGILKEEEEAPEGEDDKPNLEPSAEFKAYLDKHPDLKAHWEAEIALKNKGIDKFINESNTKVKDLETQLEQATPVMEWFNKFDNPETVDEVFKEACVGLARTHGRPFGGYDALGNQVEGAVKPEGSSTSKYGLEYPEDDAVVEASAKAIIPQIKTMLEQMFDQRVGPIAKKYESETQIEQSKAKATESLTGLKAEFEVSSDPWVTEDKVLEAIKAYPNNTPHEAFQLHFRRQIAQYVAKHTQGKPVRNMPQGEGGGKARSDLRTGASFADIAAAEPVAL